MPGTVTLTFPGDKIGLIVRGKTSATHDPDLMAQHADCIISDGSCIGFYGEGAGLSGSGGALGLGMRGTVYDMSELAKHRPYYTDGALAKGYGVVSTVLAITVGTRQAKAFDAAWAALDAHPPDFWIVGANCSTRAAGVFRTAGILAGGLPGLDTPNNLYEQLVATLGHKCTSHSGYVGFTSGGSGYNVTVASI